MRDSPTPSVEIRNESLRAITSYVTHDVVFEACIASVDQVLTAILLHAGVLNATRASNRARHLGAAARLATAGLGSWNAARGRGEGETELCQSIDLSRRCSSIRAGKRTMFVLLR